MPVSIDTPTATRITQPEKTTGSAGTALATAPAMLHVIASPMKLNRTPPQARVPAGPFGRDADEVLREAGYGAAEAAQLEAQGALVRRRT